MSSDDITACGMEIRGDYWNMIKAEVKNQEINILQVEHVEAVH